jgi:RNA:NAD 2'-phosphotransferase (TPT1/KptA family)
MIKLKEILTRSIPKHLYHGTFGEWLPHIQKDGILPHGGGSLKNFDCEWGVYLSEKFDAAGGFVESSENENIPVEWFDNIVILTINTSTLDQDKLDIDPNIVWYKEEIPTAFIYRGIIPSASIMKVEKWI